jgi:hypothetical protein
MKAKNIIKLIKDTKTKEGMKKIQNIKQMIKLSSKNFNQKLKIQMKILKSFKNMEAIEIKNQIIKKTHIKITKGALTQNRINKTLNPINTIKSSKIFNKTINFTKLKVKTNSKKRIKRTRTSKKALQT